MTFFAINTCFSKYTIFSGELNVLNTVLRLFELFLALLAFSDMIFFQIVKLDLFFICLFFTCIPYSC